MKILIVDDSRTTRKLVGKCIRDAGFGGHVIEEASDGLGALQQASASAPDLIVTDWNMPHMSGIELVQQLRETGNQVRVGFITSEGTDDMREAAKKCGAAFFITKPISVDAMRAALQGILS